MKKEEKTLSWGKMVYGQVEMHVVNKMASIKKETIYEGSRKAIFLRIKLLLYKTSQKIFIVTSSAFTKKIC